MEQVWTADGQEPRELRADASLRIYENSPAPPRRDWLGLAVRRVGVAAALGLAAFGLARHGTAPPPPAPAAIEIPYLPDRSLAPLIALPALPHEVSRYVARTRASQGGRWDTLSAGDWPSDGMYLGVTLRQDDKGAASPSLFVDLATQAAEVGAAVIRSTSPELLASARGRVEWSEATLSDATGERDCVGFRLAPGGAVRISGLVCAERGGRLDQASLGCLIGALSATPAGLKAGLGDVLPNATGRHAACSDGGA
jgi:hypothetical protein